MSKYLVILHDAQDESPAGREELKLRMGETLGVSAKALESIFHSLPVIVRRDLDEPVAARYAETLEKLGAVVEVMEQPDESSALLPSEGASELALDALEMPQPSENGPSKKDDEFDLSLRTESELSDLEAMLDQALGDLDSGQESSAQSAALEESDSGMSFAIEEPTTTERRPVILDMLEAEAAAESETNAVPDSAPHADATPAEHVPESSAVVDESTAYRAAAPRPIGHAAFQASTATREQEPDQIPPRRRSGAARQAFAALMVGFLLVVLAFAKPMFRALLGGNQQTMNVSFDLERMLAEQRSILGLDRTKDESLPRVITGQWVGEQTEAGVTSRLRITEIDGLMELASLDVTSEEPRPLTQKELVDGKPLPVWLRRCQATNVKLLPAAAESPLGPLRFVGNGRAYLQDGKGSDRQLVEVEIEVTRPEGRATASARWTLRSSLEGAPPSEANELLRLNKKEFRVNFRGKNTIAFENAPTPGAKPVSHSAAQK